MFDPKIKDVWSVFTEGEAVWSVFVRDMHNKRYQAAFDPQNGQFKIEHAADVENLPDVAMTNDYIAPISKGLWIPVDAWLERFAPDAADNNRTVRNAWSWVTSAMAMMFFGLSIVWAVVLPEQASDAFGLMLISAVIFFISVITHSIAKHHVWAVVSGMITSAVALISLLGLFICWIESLP